LQEELENAGYEKDDLEGQELEPIQIDPAL
jgi:hypothetical protein